jgi:predicted nucleic acid-binding protein
LKVLIDTPIWSLALRRQAKDLNAAQVRLKDNLAELTGEDRAEIIGPIRQELLSGIADKAQFEKVRQRLRDFDDVVLTTDDYEEAARMANRCRGAGVAGSPVDFLICAAASRREWEVFTTDRDFERYAKVVDIGLFHAE